MGRIRPRFIKRVASEILDKYTDELTIDYDKNRDFLDEVLDVPSQTVKNRIVGYVTTLKKQEERAKLS